MNTIFLKEQNNSKKTVLITGGSGLLGVNWGLRLSQEWHVVLVLNERELDIPGVTCLKAEINSLGKFMAFAEKIEPDLIVHTAGLTNIEICEKNPEFAKEVNVYLSEIVGMASKRLNAALIHISTDNLFDGKDSLVTEEHSINPLNVYGKTKAQAEEKIHANCDDYLIVRTNFFGWGPSYKRSFSDIILSKLGNNESVSLFSDVYYTPIYIPTLIDTVHEIFELHGRGVFHVVGDSYLSKYDFGVNLANLAGLESGLIKKGKLSEMQNLVSRPFDMSLSNKKARNLIGSDIGEINTQLSQLLSESQEESSQIVRSL